MTTSIAFKPLSYTLSDYRTYVWSICFIAGNILLPQLCHLIPDGGKMFLPIYFFTLIASYKFGLRVGLLTAFLSPIVNHLLFGMPTMAVLPVLLVKSSVLAVAGAWIAGRSKKISILHIAAVVLAYQTIGGVAEFFIMGSADKALQDFTLGFPGMLFQVVGGWALLRLLAAYEH